MTIKLDLSLAPMDLVGRLLDSGAASLVSYGVCDGSYGCEITMSGGGSAAASHRQASLDDAIMAAIDSFREHAERVVSLDLPAHVRAAQIALSLLGPAPAPAMPNATPETP